MPRGDGRVENELRPLRLIPGYLETADGSVMVEWGKTRVLCACTVDDKLPPWMERSLPRDNPKGWITAEYAMLPSASRPRGQRESSAGKIKGRTHEIQRLIGRSLRAVIDLNKLCRRTLILDCDVIQADGGTRCAAITGACVAAKLATNKMLAQHWLMEDPFHKLVSAVSVGILKGQVLTDLCYQEDAAAEVDMNLVMTEDGRFVEIQGTGEEHTFDREQLNGMLSAGEKAIQEVLRIQKECLAR